MKPRYQYSNSISINDQSGDHHPFHSWRMIPCFNSPNIPRILGFFLGSVNILSRDTSSSGSPHKCRLLRVLGLLRRIILYGTIIRGSIHCSGQRFDTYYLERGMEGMEGIGWRNSSQLCDAESMQPLSCGSHFDDVYEQWLHEQWLHFTSRLNPVLVILE